MLPENPTPCPDCGAAPTEGLTCQSVFDDFLALEFVDPAYGVVHFATVACFMIQHYRYSDEGLAWVLDKMRLFLEEGFTQDEIRRIAQKEAEPARRTWKVTRDPDAPPLPKIAWSMNILDVVDYIDTGERYQARIREWARSILNDLHYGPKN